MTPNHPPFEDEIGRYEWNESLGAYILVERFHKVADTRHPKADPAEKIMMRDEG